MRIVLEPLVARCSKRQMVGTLEFQETTSYKTTVLLYRNSTVVVVLGFLNMQMLVVIGQYCMRVCRRASFAETATTQRRRARLQQRTNASAASRTRDSSTVLQRKKIRENANGNSAFAFESSRPSVSACWWLRVGLVCVKVTVGLLILSESYHHVTTPLLARTAEKSSPLSIATSTHSQRS